MCKLPTLLGKSLTPRKIDHDFLSIFETMAIYLVEIFGNRGSQDNPATAEGASVPRHLNSQAFSTYVCRRSGYDLGRQIQYNPESKCQILFGMT